MGATRGATAAWQSGTDRATRWQALIGALGGALAVSGSLLTWATVGRARVAIHGTSYGFGILTLVCGVVMLAGGIALILVLRPRTRTATALAVAAMGLTVVITVGTGLATGSLLDQAPGKAARQHGRSGRTQPATARTAVGLAYLVPDSHGATLESHRALTGAQRAAQRIAGRNDGADFRALAKRDRRARGRTALGPGPFIGLVGGLLGLVAGLWALLGSRTNRPVLVATAPRRVVPGPDAAESGPPSSSSSYVSARDVGGPTELLDPRRALAPGPDAPGNHPNAGGEPPR
jgi:hypothetical protein